MHRERRRVAVLARERHQHAVGAEGEHRDVRLVRPETVTRDASRARLGPVDDRRVRLEPDREPLLVGADLRAQAPPVLVHVLTSSPVLRPRLSDSNGPSLTPPCRVEKTTSQPGAPHRKTGGLTLLDQLPGGRELRLPAVELAVQLPAPQLVEDLPHSWGLGQAELGDVRAGDLESDAASRSK